MCSKQVQHFMADSTHFVPATLTLCQFCEFKCGHSISFTTQSLPKPVSDHRNDDGFRIDDSFSPPFRYLEFCSAFYVKL